MMNLVPLDRQHKPVAAFLFSISRLVRVCAVQGMKEKLEEKQVKESEKKIGKNEWPVSPFLICFTDSSDSLVLYTT